MTIGNCVMRHAQAGIPPPQQQPDANGGPHNEQHAETRLQLALYSATPSSARSQLPSPFLEVRCS